MTGNKMHKRRMNYWAASAWLIWFLTVVIALRFVALQAAPTQDARRPVVVSEAQRVEILKVMRENLVWMDAAMGALESRAEPACPRSLKAVMENLRPPEWISLGRALHSECLDFVNALKENAPSRAMAHLRGATRACIACHQAFRLEVKVDPLGGL